MQLNIRVFGNAGRFARCRSGRRNGHAFGCHHHLALEAGGRNGQSDRFHLDTGWSTIECILHTTIHVLREILYKVIFSSLAGFGSRLQLQAVAAVCRSGQRRCHDNGADSAALVGVDGGCRLQPGRLLRRQRGAHLVRGCRGSHSHRHHTTPGQRESCLPVVKRTVSLIHNIHNQARNNNISDVAAKDGSQETMVNLTALCVNLAFLPWVSESPAKVWMAFVLLTCLHLYANFKASSQVLFYSNGMP